MRNEKGQFIKGTKPWNTGKETGDISGFRVHGKTTNTGKTRFKIGDKPWNTGIKKRLNNALEIWRKNGGVPHNFKGEAVGYYALHSWIRRHYGSPKECCLCGENNPSKRYEWANISGKYKRDINDFIRLCKKCHNNLDGVNICQQKRK